MGHPQEAVKIDNDHIAVYSEQNVIASLNTQSGAIGTVHHHEKTYYLII